VVERSTRVRMPSRKRCRLSCLPDRLSALFLAGAMFSTRVQRQSCSASVSAVRRLLPSPSSLEQKPAVRLGSMRWVDVAGRSLRRTWITHWRRQYVEVIPLTALLEKISSPPRPPRAVRSHHRWSWQDRLARNAWWGPALQRVTFAGVPDSLAMN